jgi:hypothetical protein
MRKAFGNTLRLWPATGYVVYAPNHHSTPAYQMNIGIQREIVKRRRAVG